MSEKDFNLGDLLYRAGEHASIKALLADRDEMTVYLKVEALAAEHERLREAATALYIAARWESPVIACEQAVVLWTALRDALSLPVGTATQAGVAAESEST